MKRLLLLLPLLLLGCERDPNYINPDSPKAYCARTAGKAQMIGALRDEGMSVDTVKDVLAINAMYSREEEQTLKIVDLAFDPSHDSPSLLKMKVELICHQENWTPMQDSIPIIMVSP